MMSEKPTHILYHYDFSICSIMVRYAFALRGQARDQDHEIRIREQSVDIMKAKEQLSEHYLCVRTALPRPAKRIELVPYLREARTSMPTAKYDPVAYSLGPTA